jgi:hypothetical protein
MCRRSKLPERHLGCKNPFAQHAISIALGRNFGFDPGEYPAGRRRMARVWAIPGFIKMPGIPSYY